MRKAIENNAKLLALFAIACTALVSLIHLATKDKIVAQEQQQLINTLAQLVAPESYTNEMNNTCIAINDSELSLQPERAYLAFSNETPVAMAITTTAPDGYNGNISLLVAIDYAGTVLGVRTLKHQETPGLGDKVELRKSRWILSFNQQKLVEESDARWAVKKDGGMFDQFTGATITPRAVVNTVKRTVKYVNQHKDALYTSQQQCQEL